MKVMAAEIGNKYAEKWTEEAVMGKLTDLLKAADYTTYIGEGLSEIGLYHQWFSEMATKFKESEQVSDTIKEIEQKYEAKLVSQTLKGFFNPTMAIFTLKNKHYWKDKTETINNNINYNSAEMPPEEIKGISEVLESKV